MRGFHRLRSCGGFQAAWNLNLPTIPQDQSRSVNRDLSHAEVMSFLDFHRHATIGAYEHVSEQIIVVNDVDA
jgi:hypothetical protein